MGRAGGKRGGSSLLAVAELERYAEVVRTGLRDAYLLDGAAGTLQEAQVVEALTLVPGGPLLLVRLAGDNLVLTRPSVLESRIAALHSGGAKHQFPFLVSVDAADADAAASSPGAPRLLNDTESDAVIATLQAASRRLVQNSAESCVVDFCSSQDDTASVQRVVGWPLVAGWLLGYPCLYHSVREGAAFNLLAMQRLCKVSIMLSPAPASTDQVAIDLLEFTVPVAILQEHPDLAAHFSSQLESRLNMLASTLGSSLASRISLVKTDCILPAVVL